MKIVPEGALIFFFFFFFAFKSDRKTFLYHLDA